ncbi:MAG: 4Fe-4S binding protein [SAR324 cluster bacterium]|nr:4Fe-4S binding protein [SAR324 cluster bacterium]
MKFDDAQEEAVFGQSTEITGYEAINLLESAISENFQTGGNSGNKGRNLFGRRPLDSNVSKDDLSFTTGLSMTGLRAAVLLDESAVVARQNQLISSSKRHLSYILHLLASGTKLTSCPGEKGHAAYHAISGTGFFQFFASNVQETLDLCLIAHKIAEQSLIPGINAMDSVTAESTQKVLIPEQQTVRTFLGDPDDQITSPTPAQEMIFGKMRRRIPNWFNFDYPTLNGSLKDAHALTLEIAAQKPYFFDHLPQLSTQIMAEFSQLFGRSYSPVSSYQIEDADYVILAQGGSNKAIVSAVDELRAEGKIKAGCLNLTMLRPFPGHLLAQLLGGKKAVTVLEQISQPLSEDPPLFRELSAALAKSSENSAAHQKIYPNYPSETRGVRLYCASYGIGGLPFTKEEGLACFDNMIKEGKRRFFSGVKFVRSSSKYPKQEILFQTIRREYPHVNDFSLELSSDEKNEEGWQSRVHAGDDGKFPHFELPLAVRHYQDQGPPYSRLSHFYDQTGHFYQTGQATGELTADPFQALPVIPPATANCRDMSQERSELPKFLSRNCTGCGQCYLYCPHSAIPPRVLHMEMLIKSAAEIAASQGAKIAQLTPAVKNLAKLANRVLQNNQEEISKVADVLPSAFDELAKQMKLEGDRLDALQLEFDSVLAIVSELPVSVTEPFFSEPEKQKKGSGEIFFLSIDPQTCTGCGLCAAVCEEDALAMTPQTADDVSPLRSVFHLWESLPDTSFETIRRMHKNPQYPALASILLCRNFYMTMVGGRDSEDNSEKTMLHLITATVESIMQPQMLEQVKEIEELIEKLSAQINERMAEALPTEDFQSLSKAISTVQTQRIPFEQLVQKMGVEEKLRTIELEPLERLTELVQSLQDLRWMITVGPSGVGRARFGMSMADYAAENRGNRFPDNPYCFPLILQWQEGFSDHALGLFQGQLRHFLDNIRLVRRARLEASKEYDPELHDGQIADLDWGGLTEKERASAPPIFLTGQSSSMMNKDLSNLSSLLSSGWPVKIVLFDTGPGEGASPKAYAASVSKVALLAISHRNAFVLQSSMATPNQLYSGLAAGIASPRPALFHLHAPSAGKEDPAFTAWPLQLNLALKSRTFPSLCFNPDAPGVFGTHLDLAGNPEQKSEGCSLEISYTVEGKEASEIAPITFADWALTKACFQSHFTEESSANGNSLHLNEFLQMEEKDRKGKTPFIVNVDQENKLQKLSLSLEMADAADSVRNNWKTLQEIGGVVTPFTEKVRAQIEEELAAEHQKAMDQLKAEFELKLQQQEDDLMRNTKQKLREKLLALTGYQNPDQMQ